LPTLDLVTFVCVLVVCSLSVFCQTRFAARELSTALFPAFFGAGFDGAVGLPIGTPLSFAAPLKGGRGGGGRALLLSGKEEWVKDPWAPQVDGASSVKGDRETPASDGAGKGGKRLVQLLHLLHLSPADEWPLPRCCHPRRADKRHLCQAAGQGSGL
jgi:hypothetical protein